MTHRIDAYSIEQVLAGWMRRLGRCLDGQGQTGRTVGE
jgi:hypothetical protein